jgi:phage terminase large subunit
MEVDTPMDPLEEWARRYYHDPVRFVRDVLGVEPYPWQITLMTNIARTWAKPQDQRTSRDRQHTVRSGHRVGKSTVIGWMSLWIVLTRWRSKVIITAPTAAQVNDAVMAEMKSWARRLPKDIEELLDIGADRIRLKRTPEDAFIAAATSRAETPEALQGKHSDYVFLVGDEASGIPEAVFEAAIGSMASKNAIMLLTSNPIRGTGYFYETHNQQSDSWTCYHVSSLDIPTVDLVWVEGIILKYGLNSNMYRIRVLGEFPLADSDTIIPLELVLGAIDRDIRCSPEDIEFWGMDVARHGDDSSAFLRRTIRELRAWPKRYRNLDTGQLAGELLGQFQRAIHRPAEILVDIIGWGAGVVDRARESKLPVMGINVSESTTIDKAASYLGAGYANLRSEGWFKMREWFESRAVRLPPMPPKGTPEYATAERFITELTMVRYKFTERGKLLVESKDELRERKVGSPDMADALALTFLGRAAHLSGAGRYMPKASVRRVRPGIV